MVIIKGKNWKWVDPKQIKCAYDEEDAILLIPPTSEEIKRLKVGDRVLVGHEITDKRGYVPCCKDMIIDTDTIVAILSSSPQEARCEVISEDEIADIVWKYHNPSPTCSYNLVVMNITKAIYNTIKEKEKEK
jgi:hypothetical protein